MEGDNKVVSRTIDERIVEMQFNNQQFERGVSDSIKSLDSLKRALGMEGIERSLEQISSKFSNLGIMGVTALTNITNSAINMGKQMLASLTIDQVTAGMTKYEEKTTAVQTIMNATGKTIDEVGKSLDRLNWFTDETSYNFTDMVQNIGKFTAQGIDLDRSVSAMQGIANWAALSGQGTNEAARAMYNLSQAMGVGAVTLMDWKSISNASMDTKEFKEAAIAAAKALGTLNAAGKTTKGTLVGISNFNQTLSDKWFTSDVLMKTLEEYGEYANIVHRLVEETGLSAAEAMEMLGTEGYELGAKAFKAAQEAKTFTDVINAVKDAVSTGWMNTFENIFGNYDEARVMWTELANTLWEVFAGGSAARNEMLGMWKAMGGRESAIQGVRNAFEALVSVITPITEAFRDFFPKTTWSQLLTLSRGFENFTASLIISEETAEKIKRTFSGFFAVLDIGRMAVGGVFDVVKHLFSAFGGEAAKGILDTTASIGDFLVALRDTIAQGEFFTKIVDGIKDAIDRIKMAFANFKGSDTDIFGNVISDATDKMKPLEAVAKVISGAFGAVVKVLELVIPLLLKLGNIVKNTLGNLLNNLSNATRDMDFTQILDFVNTGLLSVFLMKMSNFTNDLGGVFKSVESLFGGLSDTLNAFTANLKVKTLMQVAIAMGVLSVSLMLLASVDPERLKQALLSMTALFTLLTSNFTKLQPVLNGLKMGGAATTLIAFSAAILILATAMRQLSTLNWEQTAVGLVSVIVLMKALTKAANDLSSTNKKMLKGASGLILLASALLIMTQAVKQLAEVEPMKLAAGLIGVGVLLGELVVFMRLAKDTSMSIGDGIGLIALAAAIKILASAVSDFGNLDQGALIQGLQAMGIVLVELAAFMKLTKDAKGVVSAAVGLTILGAAMLIFAEAINRLGSMSWENLVRGLAGMGGALLAVVAAMRLMPKGAVADASALLIISAAMVVLSKALTTFATMNWDELQRGLIGLGGALLLMAAAANAMKGTIGGSASMVVMAGAVLVLAPALKLLASIDLWDLVKALGAIAAAFAIFGVAATVLGPIVPSMLALAGAMALLGVAVAAFGIGVLALSAGVTALAVAGNAIGSAIINVVTGISEALPVILENIKLILLGVLQVIIEVAPKLAEAIGVVVLSLTEIIMQHLPQLIVVVEMLIAALLEVLVRQTPAIVNAGLNLLVQLLSGIKANIGKVVSLGLEILTLFLQGLTQVEPLLTAAVDIVIALLEGLGQQIPRLVDAGFAMIIALLDGLTAAVDEHMAEVIKAAGRLAGALVKGLVEGIFSGLAEVASAAMELAGSALNAIKEFLGIHSPAETTIEVGQNMGQGMAIGLTNSKPMVAKAGRILAKTALIAMQDETASLSADFADVSGTIVESGLTAGLKRSIPALEDAAGATGQTLIERLAAELQGEKAEMAGAALPEAAAKGMSGSKKAETAAEDKAKAIVDAFSKALAAAATSMQTIDLEHKLWTNQNRTNSDDPTVIAQHEMEQGLADMATLQSKISLQNERINLAQQEYNQTLAEFGDSSEHTKTAYNKYLQEQISLTELVNQINDLQKATSQRQKEAAASQQAAMAEYRTTYAEYHKYLQANMEMLRGHGFSDEEIKRAAASATGYDASQVATQTKDAMSTVVSTYATQAEATMTALTPEFTNWGASYSEAVGTGMEMETATVVHQAKKVSEAGIDAISKQQHLWIKVGGYSVDGFIQGMRGKLEEAAQVAADIAHQAYIAAMMMLGIASPSKRFAELGEYSVMGFANGMEQYSYLSANAAEGMAKTSIDSLGRVMSDISDVFSSDFDLSPVITPVLDMSDIQAGAGRLSSMFTNPSLNIDATRNRAAMAFADNTGHTATPTQATATPTQQFIFKQNNYSPKALSRVDIYRQTKNQFSALKGAVSIS